jgi:hypothetical protein
MTQVRTKAYLHPALESIPAIQTTGAGRWQFPWKDETISAALERDWIVFRVAVEGEDRLGRAVENRILSGGWKYALEGMADKLVLRTELPASARNGLVPEELDRLRMHTGSESGGENLLAEANRQLEELGYECRERDGRLSVPLEGWNVEAAVTTSGAGFHARIAAGKHKTEASLRAAALLLLRAGACASLARGYLHLEAGSAEAGFLVRYEHFPSAAEMEDALGALFFCCREFGKEVSVLGDERAAAAYLAASANRTNHPEKGELQSC